MYDLDLFSGVGGWGVAAEGLRLLGVELDDYAVATSRAAGDHDEVTEESVEGRLYSAVYCVEGDHVEVVETALIGATT